MKTYKAGFVGLVGLPNAGKSTLMNALVKEKVSIVNPKPQTTRRRVVGICNYQDTQAVLVDAPGLIRAEKGLNKFLQEELEDVIQKSDALIAVLNLDEKEFKNLEQIIQLTKNSGKPWLAIITKVDLVDKAHRLPVVMQALSDYGVPVLPVSLLKLHEESRLEIIEKISTLLPSSPQPLYDVELFTPHSVKELVAEIIREKCFESLHLELPYAIAIRIAMYEETENNLDKIYAEIIVERDSHKPILIGEAGKTIKKIGMSSRTEIEKLVGRKVFLDLKVIVRENWSNNRRLMSELGYAIKSR